MEKIKQLIQNLHKKISTKEEKIIIFIYCLLNAIIFYIFVLKAHHYIHLIIGMMLTLFLLWEREWQMD